MLRRKKNISKEMLFDLTPHFITKITGKHGKLQIIDIRSLESKSKHFSIFSGAFTSCKASYLLRKLAIDKIMDNII